MKNFLHSLPDDIHDRIAYNLFSSLECEEDDFVLRKYTFCATEGLQTLLNYAKASPSQRKAVLRAMNRSLCITHSWTPQTVQDSILMSGKELVELDIFEAPRFTFGGEPPTLPNLRKAVIDPLPEQLSLVSESPKLTELSVIVTTLRHWHSVVSTLASIPLKVLNMNFPFYTQNGIVESELTDMSGTQVMMLSKVCSGVENFFLNPGKSPITSDVWDMIKALPSLKILSLKLNGPIEDVHEPFIRSLTKIELLNTRIEDVQRFRDNICSLGVHPACGSEQILLLGSLRSLRKLEITLGERSERALGRVIENIEHLCIRWPFEYEEVGADSEDFNYPVYYEPNYSVLVEILQRAWTLNTLHIEQAILSADVIERILEKVGGRLESLSLCFDWQKEPAAKRMERILKAVLWYCPKLKSLTFLETSMFFRYPIVATREEKQSCRRALQNVISVLPWFESYRVISCILEHRFTHVNPENMLVWHDILPKS